MLKLKKETNEYEVTGHITFLNEEEVEQTNYSLVVDGETITVSSLDTEWEVFEAPDPVVEPEPIVEPEPLPLPAIPEPTAEELAQQAFQVAKMEWFSKRAALDKMIDEMKQGREIGLEPTPEDLAFMQELGRWINANRKPEYYF